MFGQALVFATRGASQIVPEARAPFDMGAARAAENPAARTWPRRRPEGPLDRVPEPPEGRGGQQQAGVRARSSGKGPGRLSLTESERSWKRLFLLASGAYWNRHHRWLVLHDFQRTFSASSPHKIYGKALEKCRSHPEVIGVFGEPVKGYGEMTRRGRRQHVSFIEYVKDGLKYMRVKFYIEGSEPGKQGTVHVEVKENPKTGECDFRYIFVEVGSYPGRTIVIEDNRFQEN